MGCMNNTTHTEQNARTLAKLCREYPEGTWSHTVMDDGDGYDVTFQRYSDDAEDRYVIQTGVAEQI